jgi:hypothetical protein
MTQATVLSGKFRDEYPMCAQIYASTPVVISFEVVAITG